MTIPSPHEAPIELEIRGVQQKPIVRNVNDVALEARPLDIAATDADDNYEKIRGVGGTMIKFKATYEGKEGVFRAVEHDNFGCGWTVERVDTHEHVDKYPRLRTTDPHGQLLIRIFHKHVFP